MLYLIFFFVCVLNVLGLPTKDLNKGQELLSPQVAVVSGGVESILTSPSPPVPHRRRKKSLQPGQPPSSNRASVVLPLLTNANLFSQKRNDDNIGKSF